MATNPFYLSSAWQRKRKEILDHDHHECVLCREGKGYRPGKRHTRAVIVHHVKHLKEFPELALSNYYVDADGRKHRQLISVCRACHEVVCHPDRRNPSCENHRRHFQNEEKW